MAAGFMGGGCPYMGGGCPTGIKFGFWAAGADAADVVDELAAVSDCWEGNNCAGEMGNDYIDFNATEHQVILLRFMPKNYFKKFEMIYVTTDKFVR
jgi:hypothetical protein